MKASNIFQISNTGWFHTFWISKCSDRQCFPSCSITPRAAEITVARLHDDFWVSHFCCKIQNRIVQELKLTVKMPGKCWFQDRWLKDSAYQEWVLKDKLDKRIARCAAFEIRLICLCSLMLRWSLQSLTWVLVSPYKVLIILALVQVPVNVTFKHQRRVGGPGLAPARSSAYGSCAR